MSDTVTLRFLPPPHSVPSVYACVVKTRGPGGIAADADCDGDGDGDGDDPEGIACRYLDEAEVGPVGILGYELGIPSDDGRLTQPLTKFVQLLGGPDVFVLHDRACEGHKEWTAWAGQLPSV